MTDPTPERFYEVEAWANQQAAEIKQLQAALKSKITLHEAEIKRLSIAMGVQADEIERLKERIADLEGQLLSERLRKLTNDRAKSDDGAQQPQ